jgi:hypothetical protein
MIGLKWRKLGIRFICLPSRCEEMVGLLGIYDTTLNLMTDIDGHGYAASY